MWKEQVYYIRESTRLRIFNSSTASKTLHQMTDFQETKRAPAKWLIPTQGIMASKTLPLSRAISQSPITEAGGTVADQCILMSSQWIPTTAETLKLLNFSHFSLCTLWSVIHPPLWSLKEIKTRLWCSPLIAAVRNKPNVRNRICKPSRGELSVT